METRPPPPPPSEEKDERSRRRGRRRRKTEKKRRQGGGEKNKKKQNEIPILLRAVYGRHVYTVREAIRKVCEQFRGAPKSVMKNLEDKERDSRAYARGVLDESFIALPERLPPLVMKSSAEEEAEEEEEEDLGARGYPTMSSPPAIGRPTAKERVATVQMKFFSARQKPNNALCFGLTRFAKGRDERNCVNSAEAFATSTHWGTLWDRVGDEIAEWLMLYASGFASLTSTSTSTTTANAEKSVRQLFETSGAPTVIAKAKKKSKKRSSGRRLSSEKEERLVQILGKPITSEHVVFKASMDRANCTYKKSTASALASGVSHHESMANYSSVFSQGAKKMKKKLTPKQIKKVKRRKAKRKEYADMKKKAKEGNGKVENGQPQQLSSKEDVTMKQTTVNANFVVVGNEENSVPEATPEEDTQTTKEDTPILSTQELEDDDWCIPETPSQSNGDADDDDDDDDDDAGVQGTAEDDMNDSPVKNKKRGRETRKPRPPSWVRRKLAKERAEAEAKAKETADEAKREETNTTSFIATESMGEDEKWAMLARYAEQSKQRKLERLAKEKQEQIQQAELKAKASRVIGKQTKRKNAKKTVDANHPRNIVLDRSPALYCSTFSKRPGFPAKHILRCNGSSINASRKLYADIFGAKKRKVKTPLMHQQRINDPRKVMSQAPSSYMSSEHQEIIPTQLSQKSPRMTIRISKSHRKNVLPLLRRTLRRAKKCNFAKLLDLHCPVKRSDWRTADTEQLVKLNSSHKDVSSFIWAILRGVLPKQFLGSKTTTKRRLREFVSRIVSLRRIERCTLHEAMIGVKTSDYAFLDNVDYRRREKKKIQKKKTVAEFEARKRRVEKIILWIIKSIVFPVIRSHFFVTDTDHERQKMYYYRKGVWSRIVRAKNREFVTSGRYEKLSKNDTENTLSHHSLGFSRIRWKPKKTGVRPIAMLGQPASMRLTSKKRDGSGFRKKMKFEFEPVNDRLYTISDILDHEIRADETLMGNFVSDYDETMKIYAPFAERWRRKQGLLNTDEVDEVVDSEDSPEDINKTKATVKDKKKLPKLYFVCADIKAAFDSIPTEKLETVISSLFKKQEYAMLKYRTQSVLGNRYATRKVAFATENVEDTGMDIVHKNSSGSAITSSQTDANTATADENIKNSKKKLPGPIFSPNESDVGRRALVKTLPPGSVSIDLGKTRTAYRHQALNTLREHLGNTLVKSHGSLFRQKIGIPQGSILSTKLCALFYAHMEQTQSMAAFETEIYKGTPKKKVLNEGYGDGVFMRWTDDLLFVTDNFSRAKHFLNSLLDGIAEYGVEINPTKTKINFDHLERKLEKNVECKDGCEFIPWCGLLFDTQTLEVRADYSKYLNVWLRETINLPSSHLAWKYLSNKTRSYLNHKLCALLYDPRVNSRETIATNMYQALLLCAAKTTSYVRAVEAVPGVTPCGHALLKRAIESAISYARTGARKRLLDRYLDPNLVPSEKVSRALGLLAFQKYFSWYSLVGRRRKKKNKTKHEETAAWLRAQLSLSRSMSETVAEVSKTITPACKNEFFESIRA